MARVLSRSLPSGVWLSLQSYEGSSRTEVFPSNVAHVVLVFGRWPQFFASLLGCLSIFMTWPLACLRERDLLIKVQDESTMSFMT